ncbi:MAG TPA: ImmA/IrrE family metallo-endopeptidase [Solirubrobacteraceae bacterium]|nr:ImmA/IrrE family metallo-endopeptidase [Solirubrobacteraceae bacterium]
MAAETARQTLGLGLDAPIPILETVEDLAGIPVCIQEFSGEIAGLFYRRNQRPYLFVNGAHSVQRQRFTLAHELGHCEMGHKPRLESLTRMQSTDRQEVEANYFAGAFLAPRQAVHNWADRNSELPVDLELVVRMSAFFGISAEASRIRLERSGVIARSASNKLKARIAAGEHRGMLGALAVSAMTDMLSRIKREVDAGNYTLPRLPGILVRMAREAHARELLDEEDMAALLRHSNLNALAEDDAGL